MAIFSGDIPTEYPKAVLAGLTAQTANSPSLEAVADHVSTSLFNSLKRGFAEIIPKTAAVEDMKCMERLFIAFDLSASEHADFKAAFSEVFAVGSRLSPRADLPSFRSVRSALSQTWAVCH